MARIARAEVFAPEEVAIIHVMNRVVRRCFLLGIDPVTGKNFDYRKVMIEKLLRRMAGHFGIDLLGFAILSNHFHLILRSRPDVVATWDDTEVARRWLMLCPVRKDGEGNPEEPNEMELNSLRNDAEKLKMIRRRLSDIGWWMRLVCQQIAMKANREDREIGKFWQSRFKAVRLLDEQAILACAAYVDLNPIRAALAETLADSDFTSIQRRIQATEPASPIPKTNEGLDAPAATPQPSRVGEAEVGGSIGSVNATQGEPEPVRATVQHPFSLIPDGFLSPLTLDERGGELGPVPNAAGTRCSDKGFLPMSLGDYRQLLEWTARHLGSDKAGVAPPTIAPILRRLSLDPQAWCELVGSFGRLFYNVAGSPQTVDATPSRLTQQRFYLRAAARKLFTASPDASSA